MKKDVQSREYFRRIEMRISPSRARYFAIRSLLALMGVSLLLGCDTFQSSDRGSSNKNKGVTKGTPASEVGGSDWNSGGGYAPNDQFNPWFLQNVKKVSFCIEIDESNFGLSLAKAREGIVEAIQFWRGEFNRVRAINEILNEDFDEFVTPEVATQEFVEESCNDSIDIRIQLGVIRDSQKRAVANIKNYLAFTTRTHYDPEQLRGKGFIYVAPMSGPNRPDTDYTRDNIWEPFDGLFYKNLIAHEFGHIFGATVSPYALMAKDFMSLITQFYQGKNDGLDDDELAWAGLLTLEGYFSSPSYVRQTRRNCFDDQGFPGRFWIPEVGEVDCLEIRVDLTKDSDEGEFGVFELHVSRDGVSRLLLKFDPEGPELDIYGEALSRVFLTDEQEIFNRSDLLNFPYVSGSYWMSEYVVEGRVFINTALREPGAFDVEQPHVDDFSDEPLWAKLVIDNRSNAENIELDVYQWTIDPKFSSQYNEFFMSFERFSITSAEASEIY